MPPKNRIPTHPGEMLAAEFLSPLGLTQVEFAAKIGISRVRLNELIRGKRGVTADTALRLSKALGTTAEFWMNLQSGYDLALARRETDLGVIKLVNTANRRKAAQRTSSRGGDSKPASGRRE